MPKGISIEQFCLRNKVLRNHREIHKDLFYDIHKNIDFNLFVNYNLNERENSGV